MNKNTEQKKLELFNDNFNPERENRLCVSISDIHLTDGTVGLQNLKDEDWKNFSNDLSARCKEEKIKEVTFILDGDVVDMIRSSKWAEKGIYPWQQGQEEEISSIVNEIIREIVEEKHQGFFIWLRGLEEKLKESAQIDKLNTVIILGNHDRELMRDQAALRYFYEEGLKIQLKDIKDDERRSIGRMYGDEAMFVDNSTAPYFPFYYGDRGFRFFTTHGHWRDADNCRETEAKAGLPRWSVADGWQNEVWQELKFAPFFKPCFGDTIAAGLLSTFIYKVKQRLPGGRAKNQRIFNIIDELDLYRPSYKAITRIIEETKSMRAKKHDNKAILVIEDTLHECIVDWMNWDFTKESSPSSWCFRLLIMKYFIKIMKFFGFKIKAIEILVKRFLDKKKPDYGVPLEEMAGFPAFMDEYSHYKFQIHGEGHTHKALEEEPHIKEGRPTTYVNFGTWRDQIIGRKESGYRRRSVLRAFYILDLNPDGKSKREEDRKFKYFTKDIIKWSDKSDAISEGKNINK